MKATATVRLGDLFRARKEPGLAGLPVLSVTVDNGLVHRDTLERKTNGRLAPEDHLLIRKGDIAYNMMRMWQGASGLADEDGIVSPAYVIVASKGGIDPLFASYWFKSARMIHLFRAYSYGITGDRLRLYEKDFTKIPVSIPGKSEQVRISRILETIDRAIERTAALIAAYLRLRNGLAEKLLFDQPGCSAGTWRSYEFDELFDRANNDKQQIQRREYLESGRFPIVDQGKQIIAGYSNDASKVYRNVPVIVFGDHTRELKFIDFPFVCGADGTQLLRTTSQLSIRFGYQLLKHLPLPSLGYSRHMRLLREQVFRIPDRAEQQRIVSILAAADRVVLLLQKKRAALLELKRGLMQRLLIVSIPVSTRTDATTIAEFNGPDRDFQTDDDSETSGHGRCQ